LFFCLAKHDEISDLISPSHIDFYFDDRATFLSSAGLGRGLAGFHGAGTMEERGDFRSSATHLPQWFLIIATCGASSTSDKPASCSSDATIADISTACFLHAMTMMIMMMMMMSIPFVCWYCRHLVRY
jgi:hypothetical protein